MSMVPSPAVSSAALDVGAQRGERLALSRLEIAREAMGIGFWRWELDTSRVEWDRRVLDWFELTGVEPDAVTYDHWLSRIHVDDVDEVLATIRGALADGLSRRVQYRIVLPSGRQRHITSSGVVECDAAGRQIAMLGIHQDVTAEVETAQQLAAREREVQTLNRELEDRVAERTSALLDALLHAEVGTHAKAAFLRNISHELRTPLNPILGWSKLLAESIDDPVHRKHLGHIESAAQRMLALVNDLIELTSTANDDPEPGPIVLAATIDAAIHTIASRAAAKGLQVSSLLDPAIPAVMAGDAALTLQALMRLLSNAVKFSERGRIEVRATLENTTADCVCVRFEVEDEGIGIAPDLQPKVFDAFRQVRDAAIARADGLGIGLALAKLYADRLHGAIGVHSKPGEGSTFWFTARYRLESQDTSPASVTRLYG